MKAVDLLKFSKKQLAYLQTSNRAYKFAAILVDHVTA
jgi:hypothetical protein